jgi:hypothetical protein
MSTRTVTLAILVGALTTIGWTSNAAGQAYEPNDSYLTGSGPLAAGTTYSAGTETDNDEDYYFFYVPLRAQMYFNLTATHTASLDSVVCSEVWQQTHRGYSEIYDTGLRVSEGETETAAVTLDRGKYFFKVRDECSEAGETYSFTISPPGTTSTYEPFAAACAAAHVPVVAASQQLGQAQSALSRAKRRLAAARARGASRTKLRLRKARVAEARAKVKAASGRFRAATGIEGDACAVPM